MYSLIVTHVIYFMGQASVSASGKDTLQSANCHMLKGQQMHLCIDRLFELVPSKHPRVNC